MEGTTKSYKLLQTLASLSLGVLALLTSGCDGPDYRFEEPQTQARPQYQQPPRGQVNEQEELERRRRASLPTCSEWMAKARNAFPNLEMMGMSPNGIPVGPPQQFFQVMGKPSKEVVAGGEKGYRFECRDGYVYIIVHAMLEERGHLIIQTWGTMN